MVLALSPFSGYTTSPLQQAAMGKWTTPFVVGSPISGRMALAYQYWSGGETIYRHCFPISGSFLYPPTGIVSKIYFLGSNSLRQIVTKFIITAGFGFHRKTTLADDLGMMDILLTNS